MVGETEDLLAHGEVDAVATPVRHRANTHVLDVTACRRSELSAPPLACLDRHMPVRRDAEHGTARTGRYTGEDREDQVETGHVEEDGSHSIQAKWVPPALSMATLYAAVPLAPALLTRKGLRTNLS